MGYGFKIIIRNYFFTVASKNQTQNNPTYLTKILTFDQLYLVQKKEEKEDTTTYYYNVFNVGSQLCLFVRLFDSNIQFKISLMISSTSSKGQIKPKAD